MHCLRTKPEERCTTQLISALLSQPEAAVSPRKLSQRRAWLYTGTALAVAVLATTVAPKLFQHSAVESPAAATTAGASSSTASQPSPTLSRASATPATSGAGAVLHEVTPDVPKSARNTVHGVIKLRVRVNVDSDGNVTRTHLESAGPSKYFARLATQSAQQWKFTPPQQNGAAAPSEWRLHYEFTRAGARVEASPVRTAAR